MDSSFKFQRVADNYGKLYSIQPIVAKIFPEWSGYKDGRESSLILYNVFKVNLRHLVFVLLSFYGFNSLLIQKIIDEQIRTYDASHERHFIDMYVKKMKEHELNTETNTYFTCKTMQFGAEQFNISNFYFTFCLYR